MSTQLDNEASEEHFSENSSLDESNAGTSVGNAGDATEALLARRETRTLRMLRVFVVVFLISVAVLACVGVYFYSKGNEENQFENEFRGQGSKVISALQGSSLVVAIV